MADQSVGSDRRRRSRGGLYLQAGFNGVGGGLLLLGAAAGALVAAGFAAHRVRCHKRKRGSVKQRAMATESLDQADQEENNENPRKHIDTLEAPESFVVKEEVVNGSDRVDGLAVNGSFVVFQANLFGDVDGSSEVVQTHSDVCFLKEWVSKREEKLATDELKLEGKGVEEGSANVMKESTFKFLEIGGKLDQNDLRFDVEESLVVKYEEEGKMPSIDSKVEDKSVLMEIGGWREESEEKISPGELRGEEICGIEDFDMIKVKGDAHADCILNIGKYIKEEESVYPSADECKRAEDLSEGSTIKEPVLAIEDDNLIKHIVEAGKYGDIDTNKCGACSVEKEEEENDQDEEEKDADEEEEEERGDVSLPSPSNELEAWPNLEAEEDEREERLNGEITSHKFAQLAEMNEMKVAHQISKRQLVSLVQEQDDHEQVAKLSFDVMEKKFKQDTPLTLVDSNENRSQLQAKREGHEKIHQTKRKQEIVAKKKDQKTEYMFVSNPKGHFFMVMAIATVFAALAFSYQQGFHHQSHHLSTFCHRLSQFFYPYKDASAEA